MGRILERLEGVYLLCMGVLLLLLARGEAYTFFMNPRYRWLTLAAGGFLCGIGILIAAHPRHEHHWSRMMVFAPFLALLVFVVGRAGGFTPSTPRNEPVASSSAAAAAPIVTPTTAPDLAAGTAQASPFPTAASSSSSASRSMPGGAIPINCGELYMLAGSQDAERLGKRYAVQGIVVRHPALDARGGFALLRTFIYCCAVDATAVGFLTTGSGMEDLDNGQWVRVTGRLEPMHDPLDCSALVRLPNTYVTAVHPNYRFVAEEITRIEEPEVPFSYELREREPYAY